MADPWVGRLGAVRRTKNLIPSMSLDLGGQRTVDAVGGELELSH